MKLDLTICSNGSSIPELIFGIRRRIVEAIGSDGSAKTTTYMGQVRDVHLDQSTRGSCSTLGGQTEIIPSIRMDPLSSTSRWVGID